MAADSGDRALSARLDTLLSPVVGHAGADLEQVEVVPAGRRRVVRVVVDRDGGIDLDGVATLSRAVSAALEDADLMGATPYVLEVTSPGVDRPLTAPRHWRRAAGRLVRVVRVDGTTVTGRVLGADDDAVDLGGPEGAGRLRYRDVARARVEVEFAREEGL